MTSPSRSVLSLLFVVSAALVLPSDRIGGAEQAGADAARLQARGLAPVKTLGLVGEASSESATPSHWLGVVCHPLRLAEQIRWRRDAGLMVEDVAPRSPAAQAGVRAGDLLVTFHDQSLTQVEQLAALVQSHPHKNVALSLLRDGQSLEARVSIARRPRQIVWAAADARDSRPARDGKSEDADDQAKRRTLDEAAKKAMERLKAVKARDDAAQTQAQAKKREPAAARAAAAPAAPAPAPLNESILRIAVGRLEDGPIGGVVGYGAGSWRVTEATVDRLPEEIRGSVREAMQRLRSLDASSAGPATGGPAADVPAAAPASPRGAAEVKMLKKRVEGLEKELESLRARPAAKQPPRRKEKP